MCNTNDDGNNNGDRDPPQQKNEQEQNDGSFEADVRPSISFRMIRHAESFNNQVYRNARYIYRGGTPDYDKDGWENYVATHRLADPPLSDVGCKQAEVLADYMVPHLINQASRPVRIITSPMKRTLKTIRPTLERLQQESKQQEAASGDVCTKEQPMVHIIVNGFYYESDGCHNKENPEEGMTPTEILEFLKDAISSPKDIEFVGFPLYPENPNRGWYINCDGPEQRAQSETRATKFYLWLCGYLDSQLLSSASSEMAGHNHHPHNDLFDAGVQISGEEHEEEHDKHAPRLRRRRTALIIGHGDFMGLVIKRIVAGFGHYVETEGIPHRSAVVHFNTGMSEFEYFGQGRFLVMGTNHTPHIFPDRYSELRTGGSLKDGWSYIIPPDKYVLLEQEVDIAFSDEELESHVREQTDALRALYLSSSQTETFTRSKSLDVEEDDDNVPAAEKEGGGQKLHFVVKRGLQVVGCARYCEATGTLSDVAVLPSTADGGTQKVGETLMDAVKSHARKIGRSGSLIVHPRSPDSMSLFQKMGFSEISGSGSDDQRQKQQKMESKI